MPSYYDIGDIVRISGVFTDTGGTRKDPTQTKFVYTNPAGVDVVRTRSGTATGTSNGITLISSGNYISLVTCTASGPYHYRFSSTGVVTTADEGVFRVRKRYTTT